MGYTILRCFNLSLVAILAVGLTFVEPEEAEPSDSLRENAVVKAVKNTLLYVQQHSEELYEQATSAPSEQPGDNSLWPPPTPIPS